MSPRLLAFDTSTERLSVGVLTPEGCWTADEAGGARASQRLIPLILELLARAETPLVALDAIGFGCGPGAFTGLRTACAVAQGLAFGADKPVLAIDSLLVVADDARAQGCADGADPEGDADWWVAVDARMDEVYAAHYRFRASLGGGPGEGAGAWQTLRVPALYTLPALAELWRAAPPRRVAGNAAQVFSGRLPLAGARVVAAEADRPAALLRLAARCWEGGGATPPDAALPVYLRDKVALTTAERVAARQPAAAGG
jgi:tRNA threonylcarbamoyladenosine biosynthesis protein TsaB